MSKLFRSNLEKIQKKQTWWFVTFIACHRTPQDETTGYVQESMERASHHVDMKQNSVVYLPCDDASLWWSWELATARGDSCLEKKKKVVACLAFTSSTKRENRHFRVVVVQWRQRNVNWKSVMHVQSCCFADLNPLLSCHSRCHCGRLCLRRRVKSIVFRLFPPFSLNI